MQCHQQFYPHNPLHITISSSDLRTPSKKLSSNRLGACFVVQVHFLISCMHGLAKPPALTPTPHSPHGRRCRRRRRILLSARRAPQHTSSLRLTALQRWAAARRSNGSSSMRRKKRGLSQTSQVSWCCLHVEISRVGPTFFLLAMHTAAAASIYYYTNFKHVHTRLL